MILHVEWMDATGNAGWMDPSEQAAYDFSPAAVTSIGIVVKEDDKSVTLTHTKSHGGFINGYITIPKAWIKKRKVVKL